MQIRIRTFTDFLKMSNFFPKFLLNLPELSVKFYQKIVRIFAKSAKSYNGVGGGCLGSVVEKDNFGVLKLCVQQNVAYFVQKIFPATIIVFVTN